MFLIRIEDAGVIREYKANTYYDAITLFHALTSKFHFIQLWGGIELLQSYKA